MIRLPTLAAAALSGAVLAQAGPAATPECATIADPGARLACYDARFAPALAAPAPAAAPEASDAFGLPAKREHVDEGKEMRAHVVGKITGWSTGTTFELDNGQSWRVVDSHVVYYTMPENPEIIVARAKTGAYWMQFADVPARVKVRRVK